MDKILTINQGAELFFFHTAMAMKLRIKKQNLVKTSLKNAYIHNFLKRCIET